MKTNKKGFTLIETLVVLVVLGLVAGLVIPKLVGVLGSATESSATVLENQIQTKYNEWASLGGRHATSGGAQLTYELLTVLTGEETVDYPGGTYVNAENPNGIRAPSPSTIRMDLPEGMPPDPSTTGGQIIYNNRYEIQFTPTSNKTGNWSVTVLESAK